MSRVRPIDPAETDDETRKFLDRMANEEMEYLPDGLLIMAHRPEVARAFVQFRAAIFSGDISNELKLMVAHRSSYERGCDFCQAHTGCNLDLQANAPEDKIRAVRDFENDDQFTDRERAALRLARDAAKIPNQVTDRHFEDLREHFTESEIVEVVLVCCLFGYLNCFNDTIGTTLEETPRDWAMDVLAETDWTIGQHG
jgi:uncharacterized peroxidase-related enzyme